MAKINLLEPRVAELIAAGEVVDRPASVAKELIENALDAGAHRISIELRQGGITYLRVTDDGCGIAREDIAHAFIRHATSKIKDASDLDRIGTLGFRGEALPSVAAVARVMLLTRTKDTPLGCRYRIDGSAAPKLEDAGCAVGTTIEVRDLFYNTPARMKFLKKDITEGNAIASLVDRLALANPGVSFELIREGQRKLSTPGDGDLLAAIRLVCGGELAAQMIPVSLESEGMSVTGYISRPAVCRSTRSMQTFFINARYVRSKTCVSAVEEAYKNRLMTGRFPACVLNLGIDLALVDVNVHPAKLEVRFSSERAVYNAVYSACAVALEQNDRRPMAAAARKITPLSMTDFDHSGAQLHFGSQASSALVFRDDTGQAPNAPIRSATAEIKEHTPRSFERPAFLPDIERDEPVRQTLQERSSNGDTAETQTADFPDSGLASQKSTMPLLFSENTWTENDVKQKDITDKTSADSVPYRILGELFATYLVIEQGENLVLIDKHAAHERYLYERIRHLDQTGQNDRQQLLSPVAVTLPRDEYFALSEHPEALAALGIVAEDFGDRTLLVRELPMLLDGCDLTELLTEAAGRLLHCKSSLTPAVLDELLYSVSCRAAVMAGRKSSMPELRMLADLVMGEQQIRFCPHGRPALVVLTRHEVEKMFGRLG